LIFCNFNYFNKMNNQSWCKQSKRQIFGVRWSTFLQTNPD
jgi:hypothetical protein